MSSDVCAVKFSFPAFSLSVFSVYNPPDSNSSISFLQSALRGPNVSGSPCILAGDFNLHHPLWSGSNMPQRTRRSDAARLLQVLAEHTLLPALPEGTPTFFSEAHRTWSTLDLVFAPSSVIELISRCETGFDHGSDHRSVEIELHLDVPTVSPLARKNWRETDWETYRDNVGRLWRDMRVHARSYELSNADADCVDSLVSDITDILAQAADGAVPVAKPCPYSKRWWTPELTALNRATRRLSHRAARCRAIPENAVAA